MITKDFEDFFLEINKEKRIKEISKEKTIWGIAKKIKNEIIEGKTSTMEDFFEQLKKVFNLSIMYFKGKKKFNDFKAIPLPSKNNIYLYKKSKN